MPDQDLDDSFLKGIAISVWQNSGGEDSNWGLFTQRAGCCLSGPCGISSNFWDRYEEDIARVAALGGNSFRFSFEWHRIEPNPGCFDEQAIQRYRDILAAVKRHGLLAMATLHHFTHPAWFEKRGAFLKETNIEAYLTYAEHVFRVFHQDVQLWATFNEPNCYTFCAYVMGIHPPGHRLRFKQMGVALKNILLAHDRVYTRLKALPGGEASRIGYVHQMIDFEAKTDNCCHIFAGSLTRWMTYLFGRDLILTYFKTGELPWRAPCFGRLLHYKRPEGPPRCDWFGMNFYTRIVMDWLCQMTSRGNEHLSDMSFAIDPSSLGRHLKRVNELGMPIYVTETGVADKADSIRPAVIVEHYQQVLEARRLGVDVRGVFFWTLIDNYEWHEGFRQHFGLYSFDPQTLQRRPRPHSVALLKRVHARLPTSLLDLDAALHRNSDRVNLHDLLQGPPALSEDKEAAGEAAAEEVNAAVVGQDSAMQAGGAEAKA